ncbi:hypothetical protein AgCh_001759 [Apium graveolens]
MATSFVNDETQPWSRHNVLFQIWEASSERFEDGRRYWELVARKEPFYVLFNDDKGFSSYRIHSLASSITIQEDQEEHGKEAGVITRIPKHALLEMDHMLKEMCQTFHLPVAQYWVTKDPNLGALDVMYQSSCRDFENSMPWCEFKDACVRMGSNIGEGLVGKTYLSQKSFFCKDVRELTITDHPSAHYARKCGSIAYITIYLWSLSPQCRDCVLEFFLPNPEMNSTYPQTLLNSLLATTKENLPYFMVASEGQSGQVLSVEVINPSRHEPKTFKIGQPLCSLAHHEGPQNKGDASQPASRRSNLWFQDEIVQDEHGLDIKNEKSNTTIVPYHDALSGDLTIATPEIIEEDNSAMKHKEHTMGSERAQPSRLEDIFQIQNSGIINFEIIGEFFGIPQEDAAKSFAEVLRQRTLIRGWAIAPHSHKVDYSLVPLQLVSHNALKLMELASIHNLFVHQMDVKTAFLNGDLNEEIYMKQPEGCVVPGYEDKVCRLIRSLYGLKQAPKDWYEKFHQTIISDGFQVNDSDACVYSKFDQFGCVIICLYVDDMLIFGTNIDVVNTSKAFLSSCFDMKDLGEADVILGIKITRNSYGLSLNQSHYVEKILKKFNQFDCTPVKTPYDPSIHLKKNKGHSVSQEGYAKIIGSVMFLMNHTRPDIVYAVSRLSRYTHNPNRDHWGALIRLLKYLKGTINWGLHYQRSPHVLEGYCDANWVSDNDEIQSTSGYVFTLAGAAISWKSSKQTCHAKSTQESEFIALELAGQEAEWLRCLLADISLWGKPAPSVSMHCDSQAAMGLANNQIYNGKKRHIRLRHAIIRNLIRNNVISLEYVKSERNIADPLTKGLCRKLVLESAQGMGLKPIVE